MADASAHPGAGVSTALKARLSVMMFLQFFIWGSWFVTLGTFLGGVFNATGSQTALAFSSQSYGAIVAPFVVGLIADRYFNAERILGVLHLIGGGLLFAMYRSDSFAEFAPFVIGYMIVYMPTLALVNSISFRQLSNPVQQFGAIRVWGTIGWIAAGLIISFLGWDSDRGSALQITFLLAAVASAILGIYSFTLPPTPPETDVGENLRDRVGLTALWLLKDRNFAVFFIASILICIPLGFYYQNANPFLVEIGTSNPTAKMTIGQISEVGFLLVLPYFLGRFGVKKTLLVGMAAWSLRYVMFAIGYQSDVAALLILGIALHGLCYDFFFVCGQVYTDERAGKACKSSAQGLITLATYGVGMLAGFWAAGLVTDLFAAEAGHDWLSIWLVPAGLAALVFTLFLVSFRSRVDRFGNE